MKGKSQNQQHKQAIVHGSALSHMVINQSAMSNQAVREFQKQGN